jgi:hypothetical protein
MRSHSVALTKLKSPEDSQPEGLGAEQTRIPSAARNCTHSHHLQKPPKIWECELHELTRLSQLDFTLIIFDIFWGVAGYIWVNYNISLT